MNISDKIKNSDGSSDITEDIKCLRITQAKDSQDSVLGVSLTYFHNFIEKHGGREAFENKSTGEVCNELIEGTCKSTGLSICEQLMKEKSSLVGQSNWFVSHTWSYQFLETVDAITMSLTNIYCSKEKEESVFLWFDLFSLVQVGERTSLKYEELSTTFLSNIELIGNMMMVVLPWNNPITLTRAWCVFEAYACLYTGGRFEIALSEAENRRFVETITSDNDVIMTMLAQINSAESVSTFEIDRIHIHEAIQSSVGFTELDRTIFMELQKWMITLLERNIASTSNLEEKASLIDALASIACARGDKKEQATLYSKCLDIRIEILGEKHITTLATINALAIAMVSLGNLDEAEALHRRALSGKEETLGLMHKNTINSVNNLGILLQKRGKLDAAMEMYQIAIQRYQDIGSDILEVASSRVNVANILLELNRFDDAGIILQEIVDLRSSRLGAHHPHTLATILSLANCKEKQNMHEEAEELCRHVLSIQKRVLGDNHIDTLNTNQTLGTILMNKGMVSEAVILFEDVYKARKEMLGSENADTLNTLMNVVSGYCTHNRLEEALAASTELIELYDKTMHSKDMVNFGSVTALANHAVIMSKLDRMEDSLKFTLQAVSRQESFFGFNHPTTLVTLNSAAAMAYMLGMKQEAKAMYKDLVERTFESVGRDSSNKLYQARVEYQRRMGVAFNLQDVVLDTISTQPLFIYSPQQHETHALKKMERVYKGVYCCDVCKEDGIGWVYHCEYCGFDAHIQCIHTDIINHFRAYEATMTDNDAEKEVSMSFHDHSLKLKPFVYQGYFLCDVCAMNGFGWAYSCTSCASWDCHPTCAIPNLLQESLAQLCAIKPT